ncbi:MAG: peptide chain release factor 1 [Clostridia bacterium]|nr:peptide chain release factor 1 [Clostridia bacterium]
MLEQTIKIKQRFDELTELVVNPDIIADNKQWQKLVKERSSLEELAECHDRLVKLTKNLSDSQEIVKTETDPEMLEIFKEDIQNTKAQIEELNSHIQILLLPKDENDDKDVILEVRPAAGGEEASLFANSLMNMYLRYAERNRWKVEINDIEETELGGLKDCSITIKGNNVFSKLKYESGVHRVQRVPETESQGRVHTSTVTVAVLPEIEEVDFEILDKDLRVDTYRSSGAGGQHVNKTDSAIRMTHLPTNIVVTCQDERSQLKNREKAMNLLKAKLYDYYKSQIDSEYCENRKNQVGTGDRSERIRTYNFPQGRITDHRINYSIFAIDTFLDGDIEDMIDHLQQEDQRQKLENLSNK